MGAARQATDAERERRYSDVYYAGGDQSYRLPLEDASDVAAAVGVADDLGDSVYAQVIRHRIADWARTNGHSALVPGGWLLATPPAGDPRPGAAALAPYPAGAPERVAFSETRRTVGTLPPLRDERELREAVALLLTAPYTLRRTANFAAIRDHVVTWAETHGHGDSIPVEVRDDPPRDTQGRFAPAMTPERRRELLALSGYPEPEPAPASLARFGMEFWRDAPPPTPDGRPMSEARRAYLLALHGFVPAKG